MKAQFTVYKLLGSFTNVNDLDSAINSFNACLDAKSILNNKTKEVVKSREHAVVGYIHSGIKGMGNIPIVECSDTGDLITELGKKLDEELERIKAIEKNRTSETYYFDATKLEKRNN